MTLLSVQQLSIQFANANAPTVQNVSFDLKQGKVLAIVGESGSGKSLTAQALLRLQRTVSYPQGNILIDGIDILHATESELSSIRGNTVSMIFQEPMNALNPLHTLQKQLTETLNIHQPTLSKAQKDEKIDQLLSDVELSHLKTRLSHYPHQLSGGERQRIMIAMALANSPKILIADEPTTALDVTTQAHIIATLRKLQTKYQMAIILITHELHLVKQIADTIIVMKDGHIVEQGTTDYIFNASSHPYTTALLDAAHTKAPVTLPENSSVSLSCNDLSVIYPKPKKLFSKQSPPIPTVHPLSLSLHQGETIGIVGESGSGKTSLGLALARLISSSGAIYLNNSQIDELPFKAMKPIRRELQFVFQDPFSSLNPRMNIEQIILEGIQVHEPTITKAQRNEKLLEVLNAVGLPEHITTRYPHEFSGGQRQRISIARALILNPQCIIFDEPTSALDMTLQVQIIALLKDYQRHSGTSYIFISHDMNAIRSISHTIIVLQHGRIVEHGTADMIFSDPKEAYTKELIAASGI